MAIEKVTIETIFTLLSMQNKGPRGQITELCRKEALKLYAFIYKQLYTALDPDTLLLSSIINFSIMLYLPHSYVHSYVVNAMIKMQIIYRGNNVDVPDLHLLNFALSQSIIFMSKHNFKHNRLEKHGLFVIVFEHGVRQKFCISTIT